MSKVYYKAFEKIRLKWQLIRFIETVLLAAIFTVPIVLAAKLFDLPAPGTWILAGVSFLVVGLAMAYKRGIFSIQSQEVSRYLNLNFAQLENSAEIVLKENLALTAVERIQKRKIEKILPLIIPEVKITNKIGLHLILLGVAILFLFLFPTKPDNQDITAGGEALTKLKGSVEAIDTQNLPPEIKEASVNISPPAYTGLGSSSSQDLRLSVPENSLIVWNITFSDSIAKAYIIFNSGDSLALQKEKRSFTTKKRLKNDGFYFIAWYDVQGDMLQSPYWSVTVQVDQPPLVEIKNPVQYMDLPFGHNKVIQLSANTKDDYGLSAAYIVATVSRGSGEAVKFREQKMYFDKKFAGNPKTASLEQKIDLKSLGMAPGDELYYHIVVADNRVPQANTSRTDTYFITIPDTARNEVTMASGLGVDQMPVYFRSQRQIIIDTEKIIEEAPKLLQKEYQERLNALGIDQKLLRLRYGQFLGEEFESGITAERESLAKEESEEHDHVAGEEHDHHEEEKAEEEEDVLMESYMHIHDYQGEATFFDDAIKTQLKAALSQMWEAELRLRTFRPKDALPFEYKALELIKAIQQKSRVYVERIGFEPPVLKPEENRLTGDLEEVEAQRLQNQIKEEESYPEMRAALAMIESILQKSIGSILYDKILITKAGQELAGLAVQEPGRYLKPLASFSILANENIPEFEQRQHLLIIQEALHKALPNPKISPYKNEEAQNDLYRLFRMELSRQHAQ